ncbi:MAG: IPT/TIG domain-containing protein [Acidobacteriota bacterium]|nr:IPT/TIG domain-containing protein [Acidobacteriota bacterium]
MRVERARASRRSSGGERARASRGRGRVGRFTAGGLLALAVCASPAWLALTAVSARALTPTPAVSAVSPAGGPAAGGTEVLISGEGFRECSLLTSEGPVEPLPRGCEQDIVRFGEEPGLVVGASATQIDAFAPAHAAGAVDVTVSTPDGTSHRVAADEFLYSGTLPPPEAGPPPSVSEVTPRQGPQSGFTEVTIRGAHLLPAGVLNCVACAGVVVRFGSLAVPVLEGNQEAIGVVAPPHPPGTVAVTVSTPAGMSETSGYGEVASYAYLAAGRCDRCRRPRHGRGRGDGRRDARALRYAPRRPSPAPR